MLQFHACQFSHSGSAIQDTLVACLRSAASLAFDASFSSRVKLGEEALLGDRCHRGRGAVLPSQSLAHGLKEDQIDSTYARACGEPHEQFSLAAPLPVGVV
jgi:hypothetical protein